MIDSRIIKDIASAIKNEGSGPTPYDTTARVVRVEDGVAWVHIPGGVEETPADLTINATEGDQVQVRISGGHAFLVGNGSAPPTDDRTANEARVIATDAGKAANTALQDAARAAEAANAAEASAENAQASATAAGAAASQAQTSANTANTAANSALTQLSVVEDVVGTLNWISQHGTYAASTDTEVVPGKYYFTRSGAGTEADPYVYTVVVNPSGNPSTNNYYELESIDEAVSNYVAAHLALTDEGLWVLSDNTAYKLLISNTGIRLYNDSGDLIAEYSDDITLGDSSKGQINISADGLRLTDSNGAAFFEVNNKKNSAEKKITEYPDTYTYSSAGTRYDLKGIPVDESSIRVKYRYQYQGEDQIKEYVFTAGQGKQYSANLVSYSYVPPSDQVPFHKFYIYRFSGAQINPIFHSIEYTSNVDSLFYTIGRRLGEAGTDSVVIGEECEASAENSYAEGYQTKAGGLYSHAQNLGTVSNGDSQTVVGKYNVIDEENKYAFIVGNGTGDSNRSNALAIDWEGNIEAAGGGGSNNYNDLMNKPQIESATLSGNKTFEDLGLEPIDYIHFNW